MVYTFYSYKGGVGRSMALVNTAELMYQAGLRVIMLDWDLEAPGLERFYPELVENTLECPGIIDVLLDYKERASRFQPDKDRPFLSDYDLSGFLIDIHPDIETEGKLWLFPAGYRAGEQFLEYANRVKSFDWQDFYLHWEGEVYFEWFRQELEKLTDVILIDSRTGVTEMGVCTYQLADVIVMLSAPNEQNMDGTLQLIKSYKDRRLTDLRRGRKLTPIIVPSRVERVSETTTLNAFRQEFTKRFAEYVPEPLHNDPDAFVRLEIPYVPLYAFEEIIAVHQGVSLKRAIEMEQAYGNLVRTLANLSAPESMIRQKLASYLTESPDSRNRQELDALERIEKHFQDKQFKSAYGLCQQMLDGVLPPQSALRFQRQQSKIIEEWNRAILNQLGRATASGNISSSTESLLDETKQLLAIMESKDLAIADRLKEFSTKVEWQVKWQREFQFRADKIRHLQETADNKHDLERINRELIEIHKVSENLAEFQREHSVLEAFERELSASNEAVERLSRAREFIPDGDLKLAEVALDFSVPPPFRNLQEKHDLLRALTRYLIEASEAMKQQEYGYALERNYDAYHVVQRLEEKRLSYKLEDQENLVIQNLTHHVESRLNDIPPDIETARYMLRRGVKCISKENGQHILQLNKRIDLIGRINNDLLLLLEKEPGNSNAAKELIEKAHPYVSERSLLFWDYLIDAAALYDIAYQSGSEEDLFAAEQALQKLPEIPLVEKMKGDLSRQADKVNHLLILGEESNRDGDLDAAYKYYERALQLSPNNNGAKYALVQIEKRIIRGKELVVRAGKAVKEGDLYAARKYYEESLVSNPASIEAKTSLEEIRIRVEKLAEAGKRAEAQRDFVTARQNYAIALQIDPDNIEIETLLNQLTKRTTNLRYRLVGPLTVAGVISVIILTLLLLDVLTENRILSLLLPEVSTPTTTPTVTTPSTLETIQGTVLEPGASIYSTATSNEEIGTMAPSTTLSLCALAGTRYQVSLTACELEQPIGWIDVFDVQALFEGSFPTDLVTPLPSHTPTVTLTPTLTKPTTSTTTSTSTPTKTSTPTLAPTSAPTNKPILQVSNFDEMTQVFIPFGAFTMGNDSGNVDERPAHSVFLDSYWIDQKEVTNAQFARFVAATEHVTTAESEGVGWIYDSGWREVTGANWRFPQGPGSSISNRSDHPVVQVSWHDAQAYCTWVGRRLPTEAEWEKAARGTDERDYSWGNEFDGTRLNFCDINCNPNIDVDDGHAITAPVGSYPSGASPYGVLDMAGNVFEWAADWYASNYYLASPTENPAGPDEGQSKVIRGGSWQFDRLSALTFAREVSGPDLYNDNIGFRCVQDGR